MEAGDSILAYMTFPRSGPTNVRAATSADIPRIIELERACATAAHWSETQYQAIFDENNRPRRFALVIEEGSFFQGFLIARQLHDECEIENVVISASARRRGLATILLQELTNKLRQENGRTVFLEVRESNHAARRFYEKVGFREIGCRRAYYSSPEEDAIQYRLSL